MNDNKRLLDKKAIITGGSRGIGAGIVKRLYDEGVEIRIADLKKDLAEKLITDLDKNNGRINFFEVDVTDETQIINLFEFASIRIKPSFLINLFKNLARCI